MKKARISSISQRYRRRLKLLRQVSVRMVNGKLVISSVAIAGKSKNADESPVKSARRAPLALALPIENTRPLPRNGPTDAAGTALPPSVTAPSAGRRPFVGYDREEATYARMKPELLTRAEGKFVVLVGDDLRGPVETFGEALRIGYRQFGLGPLYIKQVLAEEPVAETSREL